jgi:hypothetical protein
MLKLPVPIDGSECLLRALGHAIELCEHWAGRKLVHIAPHPLSAVGMLRWRQASRWVLTSRRQNHMLDASPRRLDLGPWNHVAPNAVPGQIRAPALL